MTVNEIINTLEALCAEPEDGQEARLDADELDAVLYAIKVLKGEEIPRGEWAYVPPHNFARRFGKWQYLNGGCYKCSNCDNNALHDFTFCPNCGAQMSKEATK